jgi:hypothetical protein
MKYLTFLIGLFFIVSCSTPKAEYKIPVYAWLGGPGEATDEEIKAEFTDFHHKGIDGLMYNGGHDPDTYRRVGKISKEAGLEFHAWIPTMVQGKES